MRRGRISASTHEIVHRLGCEAIAKANVGEKGVVDAETLVKVGQVDVWHPRIAQMAYTAPLLPGVLYREAKALEEPPSSTSDGNGYDACPFGSQRLHDGR